MKEALLKLAITTQDVKYYDKGGEECVRVFREVSKPHWGA